MAKKRYLEESERKLIESVNNAYIPTDWDEFEKRYHEMERYGDGKPRKVDKEKMEYIEDGLVSRGVGGNQLSSLLSTIVEESGGNPFSVDDSRKFRGLIQFSKERYPEKDFDRDKKAGWKKAVDNQLDVIVDHLNEYGGDYGFLDGGDGSGYMTGEEAKDAFWGRDSDIENVTRALTYGFVRPGDRSGTTENRTRVARLINEIIQPPVEAPDILEFDYDGKHYKATKPEEVTPEMRRALMLSKLVREKNKVELQDPLYTTFDEAYGRAKNKGARLFMWNGKKYSTKEEGGEVKDMEKFGKVLESLYNEDVERVRNGERAQYFGVLNDKPLKNVYPEFDLISKPANMVYKGADMMANPISKVASSGASGFLEKELAGPVYWTKKLGDFMKALYLGATRPIFNSLPESAKPLARQVFKHLYQWRHFTLPDTVRLSRELFGGEDEPESFDAAFKAAREQGLDTFEWNGNKYTTDVKEEGGETNAAEFSLPEVNVYPNNRFGDIARSQGYETAVNWQKVREGVTKGLNDFANDPRTQAVLSILPLPGGIEGVEAASPLIRGAIGKAGNKLRSMVAGMVLKTANPTEKEITDALADRYFRDVFTNRANRYFTPQEKATVVDVNIDGDKPVLVEKEAELPSFIKDENLVDTTDGVYSYKNPDAKNGIVKNGKNIKVSQVYSSIDGRGDVWLNVDGEKYKIGKMNFEKGDSFLTHVDNNVTGRNFPNKAHFDENGILVPGESKEMNESYIWWERNRPFYNSPSPRMIKVKEDGMDLINARGATGFGSDQSVLSGNVDLKSKDYKILERDPVTGWFDEVKLRREGGEVRIPKRPDGGLSKRISEDDILALVLSSNANFVNRLKQEGRSTIPDWKVEGNIATHKLSAEIGEDGRVYVYPNVQEIDGKLKDFTDPKYGYSDEGRWDAMDSAIKHNDYVVFPDIESAVWFTENYKNKGWFPEFLDGGLSRLAPRDNTSVGRPGPADVQPVKPNAAARENPVVPFVASLMPGIGDVMDAHDFIEAARNKNMVGMALAAAGFIPLVGDAFQEAVRFARGRRNSYIRYDAPPRRNDITEGDEELLEKMPDYARPGYPAIEALNVHRRRLSDGAYEQRTGVTGEEAKRELEGFAETFPGIYDRIFDLDYINENDIDVARRVIELIDKRPKGSANTMSEEGVVKRLNEIKQSIVRSSPAFTEGTEGNSGIITLDNWSDFFMDEAYRSGISHELDHAVYLNTPKETIKKLSGEVGDWFDASKIENEAIRNYVSKPIELLARGTQIKDFYGLTNNAQKITPEMLKFAAKHYADNVMDNQMTEFFNGIKDWDKAAEWISKYSTATLPAIAVSKLLQDGKEKDEYPVNKRHGGPMSEDGSVGGDYILDDGGRSLYRRSEYIKNRLLSKYNLLPEESDGIISDLIGKSSLDEKFYDPRHKSYGIGQWSGKDLKEFVLTYKDGGLVDQIDFLAKKYWDGFGKDGKGDIESGVFDEHKWVVKRIGNEEFYTNSPLLKTLPSMSREDVALSLLPPELWPGVLKRKEDVTGRSTRRHFIRGGEVSELQDYIYDRLTKEHGIAPIQAIGIVANLTQESALNYDALGDNGRSYGIQQWQGDRRKNLFEFAKKRGRDKPALDDQVDFLVEEYKGDGFLFPTRGENMYKTGKTDKDMFDYFQYSKLDFDNAANIYDSTRAWAQGFGRGNKNFLNMDRRFHIAKTLSSRYNIDAGGQSFYTDMGYKDEWGSPIPEVAVSAEKKAAQDDWMEKYGNKMLASILAGDGEGGDTHVTNNYYVNEEGLSEDEKRNAAEVRELQQKQQAQELLASIIDEIKLDIKGVTEVRKQ